MDINPVEPRVEIQAFLDELVKVAEGEQSPPKSNLGHALRSMAIGAVGGAAGYGTADFITHRMKFFTHPNENRARAARIILPILSGAAVTLADRYRQHMNEQYKQVKGYDK